MYSKRTLRNVLLSSCCFAAAVIVSGTAAVAGAYTVPASTTQTVATQITGSDNVLVAGGGTLVLTNTTNNYTGGSQVTGASTLQIDNDAELGATSSALALGNGTTTGTLTFGGATTLVAGRAVTLNAGSETINTGTFTDTIAGVISGTGSLVKTGTGTLILTGNNTFTGTTTISAGTLQIGVTNTATSVYDTTAAIVSASIINNGTLVLSRGDGNVAAAPSITYAGVISGTGAVKQLGYGTVILTGANTYTGVTTITGATGYAATLQLGDGGTTGWIGSSSVVTGTAGTLAFNRSDDITWAGVVSGTGNISKLGLNTLTVTGVNTLTGTTTVSAGTLKLSGTGAIAASAIVNNGIFDITGITATSATIKSLAGTTATATFVIGAKNLTMTSGATYAGIITGTGNLSVTGGTEVLTASNTYSGSTTIGSGATLALGSGGSGGWVASTTIVDNGTFTFNHLDDVAWNTTISGTGGVKQGGAGTLTLNGIYTYTGVTQAATGKLVIGDTPGTTARVAGGASVSSGATLTGYGQIVGGLSNSGTVAVGMDSIGTLTVGSFTQTATGILNVKVSPTAASLLQVNGAAALDGSFRANFDAGVYSPAILPVLRATSVAGTFAVNGGIAGNNAYGVIYPSATEVDGVVAPKWTAEIYGDLVTVALDNAHMLNDIAVDHVVFDGCDGKDKAGCQGWSAWAKGIGGTNHMDAADGVDGFNAHNWGIIGGLGYRFSDYGSLNVALGYSGSRLAVSGGSAVADMDNLYASVTFHASGSTIALDLNGFYLSGKNDVTRNTGLSGATATSTVKNTGGGFTFEISAPLLGGDVIPYTKASYAYVSYGPFTETGTSWLNLQGLHGEQTSGLFDIGVRLTHTYAMSNGVILQPHVMAAFEYDSAHALRDVPVSLVSFTNTSFMAPSPEPQQMSGAYNLGIDAKLDQAWTLSADVNGRHSTKQDQATFSIGASYHF